MQNDLKSSLMESLFVYGLGIIIFFLSVLFFVLIGYPLVNTATETLNIVTPPLYMNSVFLPYGMLIGELLWNLNERKERKMYSIFLFESIIVGILSFIRYFLGIPFSGHAIMLFFNLLHQSITNKAKFPLRLLIGIAVLIITAVYKIFIWNDPITFILGALVGIIIWVSGFFYQLKKKK
ncbi:MAG: hypothetical protein ACFFEO_14075 [Candidatus Thorarchaeota archaeon]